MLYISCFHPRHCGYAKETDCCSLSSYFHEERKEEENVSPTMEMLYSVRRNRVDLNMKSELIMQLCTILYYIIPVQSASFRIIIAFIRLEIGIIWYGRYCPVHTWCSVMTRTPLAPSPHFAHLSSFAKHAAALFLTTIFLIWLDSELGVPHWQSPVGR